MTSSPAPRMTHTHHGPAGRGVPTAPSCSLRRQEAEAVVDRVQSASLPRRLRLDAASWISAGLLYASLIAIFLQRAGFIHIASALLDSTMVLTATVATLLSAVRRLPLQNVLLASVVIGAGGSLTGLVAVRAGIWSFPPAAGPRLLGILPWWLSCVWIVTILASRGAALYVLGRRRPSTRFGMEVLALTTGLSLILQAGMSHFVREQGYGYSPSGGTLVTLGIGLVATVLVLCFATPILINKKPDSFRSDFQPLIVWLPLTLLLLAT